MVRAAPPELLSAALERETLADGLSDKGEMDCTAGSICCLALWIGLGLGCGSIRLGARVSVLPFAAAVYRTCAIRYRDHVLVRRHQSRHSRSSAFVALARSFLRT